MSGSCEAWQGRILDSAATWTPSRSHNFPDRYVRHAGYVPRIDPITSGSPGADKQDATFHIGF